KGLATAAAKILLLFITGAARLGHPIKTTVFIKTKGFLPNMLHAVFFDIRKFDRQLPRTVTGQSSAIGSDIKKQAAPAIHTSFGALFVVIGGDKNHFAGMV